MSSALTRWAARHAGSKAEAGGLLPQAGGPAAGWKRLSVLLRLLAETAPLCGRPVELYGQAETRSHSVQDNMEEVEKEARCVQPPLCSRHCAAAAKPHRPISAPSPTPPRHTADGSRFKPDVLPG